MKVLADILFKCPECNWGMEYNDKYVFCINSQCKNFKKLYQRPLFDLKENVDKKTAKTK